MTCQHRFSAPTVSLPTSMSHSPRRMPSSKPTGPSTSLPSKRLVELVDMRRPFRLANAFAVVVDDGASVDTVLIAVVDWEADPGFMIVEAPEGCEECCDESVTAVSVVGIASGASACTYSEICCSAQRHSRSQMYHVVSSCRAASPRSCRTPWLQAPRWRARSRRRVNNEQEGKLAPALVEGGLPSAGGRAKAKHKGC